MSRRLVAFVVLAVILAALFVRLGFWQLSRRAERRAFNAERARPLAASPVAFDSLPAGAAYRRVRLEGTPDYEHEFVLAGRSRNGSPGVFVFTPFRREGSDTAVLVNRGWLYAADAVTVDLTRARESLAVVHGFTDTLPAGIGAADARRPRVLRRLSGEAARALAPYPLHSLYVVAQDSSGGALPARLPLPELSDGPHLGYAIQWFAFALTALGGAAIVVHRTVRHGSAGSTAAKE